MSQDQVGRLLAAAEAHFQTAAAARQNGQVDAARRGFLAAAEQMMLAAQASTGRLRQTRLQLAQDMLAAAEALPRPVGTPGQTARPSIPLGEEDKSAGWLVQERPDIRFDDVAGLEDVKEQIRIKLLYPFTHPDLAEKYGVQPGGGILLYGPPGTGKTLMARAVAGEIEAAFFAIKPSEIMSQWVGKAEENLAELFKLAASQPLSVIFIDEMESLAPRRRSSNSTVMQRVVPQLLAELDGFHKRSNSLLLIGATNEPWAIDSAILRPGRLDRLIYIPPPDWAARRVILELNLKAAPLAEDVSLDTIADQTQNFSGADMASVARRVRERVFSAAIQSADPQPITMADFDAVLAETKPSIPVKDLRKFEQYAQAS